MLDLRKIVLGVSIEFHFADFNEWEIAVRPDLGKVERVKRPIVGLILRHHLDAEAPLWAVAVRDGSMEVSGCMVSVGAAHR